MTEYQKLPPKVRATWTIDDYYFLRIKQQKNEAQAENDAQGAQQFLLRSQM